jgi:hypothetical protein
MADFDIVDISLKTVEGIRTFHQQLGFHREHTQIYRRRKKILFGSGHVYLLPVPTGWST